MEWKITWSYLPIDYDTVLGTIENLTQRTTVRNNLNGRKVKIKFSNRFSTKLLVFEKVVIGKQRRGTTNIEGMQTITYGGNEKIVLNAGEEFYSDEAEWEITDKEDIVISAYIKEKTEIQSVSLTWAARSLFTVYGLNGDHTQEQEYETVTSSDLMPELAADIHQPNALVGICEIMIGTEDKVKTVALFGDSITHMSYYSDALIERVYLEYPGRMAIMNRGIGGNRLLHDATFIPDMPGKGSRFGKAGISRFEEDIYGSTCPEIVLVLIGTNDLVHSYALNHMEEVVNAKEYQQGIVGLIESAHAHGSKIFLCTIIPYCQEEMEWNTAESEQIRNECNEWIRSQKLADGVINFDVAIRDSEKIQSIKDGCHIGDWVHPNVDGGIQMAEAVDLKLFYY